MFSLRPLGLQRVAADDSVLGRYSRGGERGLVIGYLELVRAAFQPAYWEATELVEGGYSQADVNFPLFWGLALQAYQSTLVSNDSPLDRFLDGDTSALTAQEREGMQIFFRLRGGARLVMGGRS
jgi:hypothetical protein